MEDIQYNKENLVLIGAGGLGRELVSWMTLDNSFLSQYEICGFLDDNKNKLDGFETNLKVVDRIYNQSDLSSNNVLISLAKPSVKKEVFEFYTSKINVNIISFKYENVLIGLNTEVGLGNVFCPSVIISCNCKIGNGVFINLGSQIGHDVQIGSYVSIMANVDIGGGAVIEDEVFIGSGVVILPGVKIPKGSTIGAGSVVIKSIKKAGSYFGNPAKKIF